MHSSDLKGEASKLQEQVGQDSETSEVNTATAKGRAGLHPLVYLKLGKIVATIEEL